MKGNLYQVHKGNTTEIKQLENLIQRNLEELEGILDKTGRELFEKYRACVDEYMFIIREQAFGDGFCLGTRIMVEALTGAEQMLQ